MSLVLELDDDGYPTEETLDSIATAAPSSPREALSMMMSVLKSVWQWDYFDLKENRRYRRLRIATGGWSGNEDIVRAFRRNFHFDYYWVSSARGGLHEYDFPIEIAPDYPWKESRKLYLFSLKREKRKASIQRCYALRKKLLEHRERKTFREFEAWADEHWSTPIYAELCEVRKLRASRHLREASVQRCYALRAKLRRHFIRKARSKMSQSYVVKLIKQEK